MNLGEFRTAINRRTGQAVDATALNEIVNEAVQAVAEERDWAWMNTVDTFPTQSGTTDYVLPADWERTVAVTIDGHPARRINAADGDGYNFYEDRPVWGFVIDAGLISIYPEPGSVLTVKHRYVRSEPVLEVDSDEPLLPARFHGAVVNYAAALVSDRFHDIARGDAFRAEYKSWLRRMYDASSRSQQPGRIRVRPGSML